MKSAVQFYRFLLSLYPASHQKAFGAQMLQTFIDHYQDVEESQSSVVIFFWLATIADEMASIARERTSWLWEGNGFWRMSPWKLVLSVPPMIPFYAISCALLVKVSLGVPHPHVSGIGFPFALAFFLVLPGIFSAAASYAFASALFSLLPRRKASAT
jgi:hypothetical protein